MRALEINEKGEFKEVKSEKNEKRLTIALPEEVHKELKMEAIRQGTSLKQLIENVMVEYKKDKFVPPTLERYYDTKDLALFTGLKADTIRKHYTRGTLKGIKYRNEIYMTTDQVKEFLDYRKKEGK